MGLLKAHHFRPSLTEEVRNPSLAVLSPPEQLTRTVDTNVQNRVPTKSAVDALNLGPPMDIQSAASLLGCSIWTVRQKLIPRELPYFQASGAGKRIFYRDQVIRWIEAQQKRRSFTV
jgi:hypothetical protein